MNDEPQRIASQLERSYFGDAWHGPSLNELIDDPDWRKVFEKPVPGMHSIYELVHHIAVWAELGSEACLGEGLRYSAHGNGLATTRQLNK